MLKPDIDQHVGAGLLAKAVGQLEDRFDFSEPYHQKPALAIPFQKGNPAFKTSLNGALKRVKDDGRLKALAQKWLKVQ